jgi:hypothetical protein
MKNDNSGNTKVVSRTFEGSAIKWTSKIINGSEQKISELTMPEITKNIITNDIVMVYINHNSNTNNWSALPLPFIDDSNITYFTYALLIGKLLLRAHNEDNTLPSKHITFRVLVLQGYTEKVSNINLLNYKDTMKFLSINQEQTQLT